MLKRNAQGEKRILNKEKNMKRIFKLGIAILSFCIVFTFFAAAEKPITVFLDEEEVIFDVEPQIINGRTLVPLRAIFEKLGATVEWNGETRTASAIKDSTIVRITIDEPYMTVNGEKTELDTPATIIGSRTLVPLRAISSAFGCKVGWYGENREISLIFDFDNVKMVYSDKGSVSVPENTVCAMGDEGWFTDEALSKKGEHYVTEHVCRHCKKTILTLTEKEIAASSLAKYFHSAYYFNTNAERIEVYIALTKNKVSVSKDSICIPLAVKLSITNDDGMTVYEKEYVVESEDFDSYSVSYSTTYKKEFRMLIPIYDIASGSVKNGTLNLSAENPYVSFSFSKRIEGQLP